MSTWYRIVCAVAVLGLTWLGIVAGRNGRWWLMLLPLIVSPISMIILREVAEFGKPDGILNPRTQSWVFLFGDTIFLPLALLGGALGWRKLTDGAAYYYRWWWLVVSVCIGVAAGVVFHCILNAPAYRDADLESALLSPTSIWHDLVVYPVLGAVLGAVCLPVLIHDFSGWGWLAAIGFGGWVLMGVLDATVHPLDPANLHPPVESTIFRR